jgi:hypothetical protein
VLWRCIPNNHSLLRKTVAARDLVRAIIGFLRVSMTLHEYNAKFGAYMNPTYILIRPNCMDHFATFLLYSLLRAFHGAALPHPSLLYAIASCIALYLYASCDVCSTWHLQQQQNHGFCKPGRSNIRRQYTFLLVSYIALSLLLFPAYCLSTVDRSRCCFDTHQLLSDAAL